MLRELGPGSPVSILIMKDCAGISQIRSSFNTFHVAAFDGFEGDGDAGNQCEQT